MWDIFLSAASGSIKFASFVLIIDWTIRFISMLITLFFTLGNVFLKLCLKYMKNRKSNKFINGKVNRYKLKEGNTKKITNWLTDFWKNKLGFVWV